MKTAMNTRLRTIPPANRHRACINSSMRAAKIANRGNEAESIYEPKAIAPNEKIKRQRDIWRRTLKAKFDQLERLIELAEDTAEADIWRELKDRPR